MSETDDRITALESRLVQLEKMNAEAEKVNARVCEQVVKQGEQIARLVRLYNDRKAASSGDLPRIASLPPQPARPISQH